MKSCVLTVFSGILCCLPGLLSAQLPVGISSAKQIKVIVFLGLECPISQKYMKTLEEIKTNHAAGADFFALVPEGASARQIRSYKKGFGSTWAFMADSDLRAARQLRAKVTPEVFVFDKYDELQYRGAIDNWFYELGKYRREPTERYLVEVLAALQNGRSPAWRHTEAIGCIIPSSALPHRY